VIRLVRHTQVARCWAGRCYGRSDASLSREGAVRARLLAAELAATRPDRVLHSGLKRARLLAERIAALAKVPVIEDGRWQERDFGSWEGQRWSAIYRATGNAMDGMIDAPASFRPGGGETTDELARRAAAALADCPPGRVIVITHGGPIAALIGMRRGLSASDWPALVPPPGGHVDLEPGDLLAHEAPHQLIEVRQ
jgi:broad specificity phosphatase PhoE